MSRLFHGMGEFGRPRQKGRESTAALASALGSGRPERIEAGSSPVPSFGDSTARALRGNARADLPEGPPTPGRGRQP
jgi:hypothetical protein